MTIGEFISNYCKEHGLSQRAFAARCGLSHGYIAFLVKGRNPNTGEPIVPQLETLKQIAGGMGLTLEELFLAVDDLDVDISRNEPAVATDVVTFDVYANVAAHFAAAGIVDATPDKVEIPRSHLHGRPASDFFVLRVTGDSMYPLYMDGDIVLVLKTPTLQRSGQVGVLQNGDDATLKKVEYKAGEDWMRLIPINPNYPPQLVEGADLEEWRVRGVPRLVIREIED